MGMNRAFRIDDARALDPYAVARILRVFIEKEAPQIVLMGKQAVTTIPTRLGKCWRDC
jgi:electron transfer flavoprotein alpha/beta subunit